MNPSTAKIRVVVANPREIFREALAALISEQPGFDVVARVGYGNDLVEEVRRTAPDILLLEQDQPGSAWLPRLRTTAGLTTPPKSVLLSDGLS